MGIQGLETFLHHHPECTTTVNIGELANQYKRKNKQNPTLIWDINSCIVHLYNIYWVFGGQLKEFANALELFIRKLKAADIDITVFVNGPLINEKLKNIIYNQTTKMMHVNKVFSALRVNQEDEIAVENYYGLYPPNINKVIIDTLNECECKVIQATFRCELEIAKYAKDNKCFGILAQDSDFVIFNSADYYFSMRYLDLDTLLTVTYSTEGLAKVLNVEMSQLPLIATLMGGNVFFHREELLHFQKTLFKKERYYRNDAFIKVAEFIKTLEPTDNIKSQLPFLAKTVLGTSSKASMLKQCLDMYSMAPSSLNTTLLHYSPFKKWSEVQKTVVDLYCKAKLPTIIFSVMFCNQYLIYIYPEDPNKNKNHSTFELARTLRQKLYGIIFNEKPLELRNKQHLKEIGITSMGDMQTKVIKPIYPRMDVSLVKLWLDTEGKLDDIKWDLFCSTLNIQREFLVLEEQHLLIPLVSFKFLLMNQFDISTWELEAAVASMVLLKHYSVEELKAIPTYPVDPDGVHLYWSFIRIFVMITDLNSVCGQPIDSKLASPVNYQDGKLFHHKYRQAKDNKSFEDLCEFRPNEIKSGRKIMTLILNDNN